MAIHLNFTEPSSGPVFGHLNQPVFG